MNKPLTPLYPVASVNQSGHIKAGSLHRVYWESCGNPKGKPVVFVHGGPGGGTSPATRRFFNPEKYHIIQFDQRGCGQSTPHACLEENTTWDLINDMENIRNMLGIKKWQVFGGSWGSTLALAYAEKHPNRVTELILRGIFLLRKQELHWFYQEGASRIFPDAWHPYLSHIPEDERHDMMTAYQKRLLSDDESVRLEAAKRWSVWEGSTCHLYPDLQHIEETADAEFALAFARIENHYFMNNGFFTHENQLLDEIDAIRHIPTIIIQGRYDVVCPMQTAYDLYTAFPEAELIVVPDAGHSAFEPAIASELVLATNRFMA
ncbi:prolyl aminopeptidase [Marinicella litoralis]|uniref:Proline iminopeptidase n=1 Tax=Marinicella litoralis TaxID=644220 RepID=A0A4R6XIX5_9GAMM|nr:prolyl aminopeptidase [Marinicella litoralis]TDR19445.1 prolyl aminopeptidase [Marinicella litoralis]